MTPQELATKAKAAAPLENVVREVLTSDFVAGCKTPEHYAQFREIVGRAFPSSVQHFIAGSGNWGFSMKPDFLGRAFSQHSDIDLAIIAPELFFKTWDELRNYDRHSYYSVSSHEREALRRKGQDIYCGFACAEWIPDKSSEFRWKTLKLLNQLSSFLVGGRQVNAFFFRDLTEAVDYYKRGFKILLNQY